MALRKGHPFAFEVEIVKTSCFRCGKSARDLTVELGTKAPPVLCKECRRVSAEGFSHHEVVTDEDRKMMRNAKCNRGKKLLGYVHLRPSDLGFAEVAAQVTPIWQVKNESLPPNESVDIGF